MHCVKRASNAQHKESCNALRKESNALRKESNALRTEKITECEDSKGG